MSELPDSDEPHTRHDVHTVIRGRRLLGDQVRDPAAPSELCTRRKPATVNANLLGDRRFVRAELQRLCTICALNSSDQRRRSRRGAPPKTLGHHFDYIRFEFQNYAHIWKVTSAHNSAANSRSLTHSTRRSLCFQLHRLAGLRGRGCNVSDQGGYGLGCAGVSHPDPKGGLPVTTARYGATGGARPGGFALSSYAITPGTTKTLLR